MKGLIPALIGILLGVLALIGADWLIHNADTQVMWFKGAAALTKEIAGFVSLAAGFGAFIVKASDTGLTKMTTTDVAGPGVLTIAGAILLAA